MNLARSRMIVGMAALLMAALAACVLRLAIDRAPSGDVSLAWPEPSFAIFRWTAMSMGIVVGVALAVSGVLLQVLLRNPLAEPFVLGISSGAGLGVMAAMYAAHVLALGEFGDVTASGPAMIGALAAMGLVYALGQRRGWLDPVSLILIGVVVSTICGAGIMFFQHLVPTGLRGEFTTWLMGRLPEHAPVMTIVFATAVAITGLLVATTLGRAMDAATLSDDEAWSVGLAIGPLRLGLFMLAAALTAMSVAIAGPIGFVGLISPHLARLVLGPRHRPLVIGAALAGIVVVVGADVLRQGLDLGAGRMPIGIFTALIGGPTFLWLLRTGRGQA